jgi:SM-20-related protein
VTPPADDLLIDWPDFAPLAPALARDGWGIFPDFLAPRFVQALAARARAIDAWRAARVGRGQTLRSDPAVRGDGICWLTPEQPVDAALLNLMEHAREAINRELILGLFEFEAHYARYLPGTAYGRHLDAFPGEANRLLSVVIYLNEDWQPPDGGELLLYGDDPRPLLRCLPRAGTLVAFMSGRFPHEVRPARRTRYSIAGWFRRRA